jgi:transposase InsO family protein
MTMLLPRASFIHSWRAVFEYIEVDYNRTRRYSANGFITPEAFEAQNVAKRGVSC